MIWPILLINNSVFLGCIKAFIQPLWALHHRGPSEFNLCSTMYTTSLKPRESAKNSKSSSTSCKWLHRIVFMVFLSYFISRVGMSCLKLMEEDLGTIQKKAVTHRVLYPSFTFCLGRGREVFDNHTWTFPKPTTETLKMVQQSYFSNGR